MHAWNTSDAEKNPIIKLQWHWMNPLHLQLNTARFITRRKSCRRRFEIHHKIFVANDIMYVWKVKWLNRFLLARMHMHCDVYRGETSQRTLAREREKKNKKQPDNHETRNRSIVRLKANDFCIGIHFTMANTTANGNNKKNHRTMRAARNPTWQMKMKVFCRLSSQTRMHTASM